jgi:hypothetical protein
MASIDGGSRVAQLSRSRPWTPARNQGGRFCSSTHHSEFANVLATLPLRLPQGDRAVLLGVSRSCGGDGTYRVSGKITFNGQPVPAGKIYFMPDGRKNTGPTGSPTSGRALRYVREGGRGALAGPRSSRSKESTRRAASKAGPSGDVTTRCCSRGTRSRPICRNLHHQRHRSPGVSGKGPTPPKEQSCHHP